MNEQSADPLTQVKELLKLGESATEGEWRADASDVITHGTPVIENVCVDCWPEDARFIAASANARPAIQALVEEVERLRVGREIMPYEDFRQLFDGQDGPSPKLREAYAQYLRVISPSKPDTGDGR